MIRFNPIVQTTESRIDTRIMARQPQAPPSGLTSVFPIRIPTILPCPRKMIGVSCQDLRSEHGFRHELAIFAGGLSTASGAGGQAASAAARAAPMMPASLSSTAGTTGVRMSMSGRNFSDFLLTPPPMMIRSGLSSFSNSLR